MARLIGSAKAKSENCTKILKNQWFSLAGKSTQAAEGLASDRLKVIDDYPSD
jgi:hypothetical protein